VNFTPNTDSGKERKSMKPNEESQLKKSYHRPQVLDYGNIKEKTQKIFQGALDGGNRKT
jgi:hypothetical protein